MKKEIINIEVTPKQIKTLLENAGKGDFRVFQIGLPTGQLLEVDIKNLEIKMEILYDEKKRRSTVEAVSLHERIVELIEDLDIDPRSIDAYQNAFRNLELEECVK